MAARAPGSCASSTRRAAAACARQHAWRTAGGRRRALRAVPRPQARSSEAWPLLSRHVAVAAPAAPIGHARATADLGQPEIEHAWLAQAGEIADGVDEQRNRQREEASRHQES